jgi:hypothetical protein
LKGGVGVDARVGKRREWLSLLTGPVAWSVQLVLVYALSSWTCDGDTLAPLHVASAFCLAAAATGGVFSWKWWRSLGGWPSDHDEAAAGASRTMLVLGVMTGTLFSVVIVAQWLAAVVLLAHCR